MKLISLPILSVIPLLLSSWHIVLPPVENSESGILIIDDAVACDRSDNVDETVVHVTSDDNSSLQLIIHFKISFFDIAKKEIGIFFVSN